MATKKLYPPGIFGVYLQVRDLDRSVSFYQNALGLEVDWNDDKLAVLHGPEETSDTVVIREIGEGAAHHLGEAGVTRLFWRVATRTLSTGSKNGSPALGAVLPPPGGGDPRHHHARSRRDRHRLASAGPATSRRATAAVAYWER